MVDPNYVPAAEQITTEDTPLGDLDIDEEVKEENDKDTTKEESKDETKEETNIDNTQQDSNASSDVVAPTAKKASPLPFVVGGAVVVIAGAGVAVWFLKKKK
jgi:hypothetical protein